MDNTNVVLILHDSFFSLAQCMGFEACKPFGFESRFDVADACFKSEDILDEVHDLDNTPLEGPRGVFMHKEFTSLGCNCALPNPLDHSHVSPICSLPSPSLKYLFMRPLIIS